MKSWRSRIAVAMGAALIALPLAAGSASASTGSSVKDGGVGTGGNHWGYIAVGGTLTQAGCAEDGLELLAQRPQRYVNFYCVWDGHLWELWALPA